MNPVGPVCRTCLGIISDGKSGYNIDEENGLIRNVRNIREMIMFCVPEMDIFISVSPSICETCLRVLVNIYNFKIRCMRVENAIRSYIIASNIMEGSCVDLSNVVRQQIIEALKQKHWPHAVIREYIEKVDKCLKKSRKQPVSPQAINPRSKNVNNSNLVAALESANVLPIRNQPCPITMPSILPNMPRPPINAASPNLNALSNNCPENNPGLNSLHDASSSVHASPPPSYEQALLDPTHQSIPTTSGFIKVSNNLMPEQFGQFSRQLLDMNHRLHHSAKSVQVAPDLTRHGPPILPTASTDPTVRPPPVGDTFQNSFLSTLNLISTSSEGRQEAVLISSEERRISQNSSPHTPQSNPATNCNKVGRLCPKTGILRQQLSKKDKQTTLRKKQITVRKYMGPKSKRKDNIAAAIEEDNVIVLDDDDEGTPKEDGEVLIMNFSDGNEPLEKNVESSTLESLFSGNLDETDTWDVPTTSDFWNKMVLKLTPIDNETLKRKLTSEVVIDEILAKRRRLNVKLNSNLPYLHKHKKLLIRIENNTFLNCNFCSFVTLVLEDLTAHYQVHHRVCKLCGFKSDKKPALDQHIDSHHLPDLNEILKQLEGDKMNFNCYLCNFSGLSAFDLRDHRIRIHIKCDMSGIYKCPFSPCKVEDAIAYNIARHLETKHDSPRRRECQLCNYMASTASSLKKHVQTHSVTSKMICQLCGFSYKTSFALNKHMQVKHSHTGGEENITGMVYAPSPSLNPGALTTDETGRITLDYQRSPITQIANVGTPGDVEETFSFGMPSLSEMLCSQTFEEVPEQEDDCTIVDEALQCPTEAIHPARERTVILNKHNRKSQKTAAADDLDDCLIISEDQQDIMTVDLSDEDTISDIPSDRQKPDEASANENSDVIEIADEDCIAVPEVVRADNSTENINFRESDNSETDTCLEVSGAQKISPQTTAFANETEMCSEQSVSDILVRKVTTSQEVQFEKQGDRTVKEVSRGKTQSSQNDGQTTSNQNNQNAFIDATEYGKNKDVPESDNLEAKEDEKAVEESNSSSSVQNKNVKEFSQNPNSEELQIKVNAKETPISSEMTQNASEKEFVHTEKSFDDLEKLLDEHFQENNSTSSKDNSTIALTQKNESSTMHSESFVIESSDEDMDDCSIISTSKNNTEDNEFSSNYLNKELVTEAITNSSDCIKATANIDFENNTNIPCSKWGERDVTVPNDQSGKSPTTSCVSDVMEAENTHLDVSDTHANPIQDTDQNVVISDSEPKNSEVIQQHLDVMQTGKYRKNITESVSNILNAESHVESENIGMTEETIKDSINNERIDAIKETGGNKLLNDLVRKELDTENLNDSEDKILDSDSMISDDNVKLVSRENINKSKNKLAEEVSDILNTDSGSESKTIITFPASDELIVSENSSSSVAENSILVEELSNSESGNSESLKDIINKCKQNSEGNVFVEKPSVTDNIVMILTKNIEAMENPKDNSVEKVSDVCITDFEVASETIKTTQTRNKSSDSNYGSSSVLEKNQSEEKSEGTVENSVDSDIVMVVTKNKEVTFIDSSMEMVSNVININSELESDVIEKTQVHYNLNTLLDNSSQDANKLCEDEIMESENLNSDKCDKSYVHDEENSRSNDVADANSGSNEGENKLSEDKAIESKKSNSDGCDRSDVIEEETTSSNLVGEDAKSRTSCVDPSTFESSGNTVDAANTDNTKDYTESISECNSSSETVDLIQTPILSTDILKEGNIMSKGNS